jgi:DNA mismatch repair protein MutL
MRKEYRIQILPSEIANKIAAGEVVERPASVVKELVENAIDADASEITIILQKGGTELIKVVDNGLGMDKDNLMLAFERHATSKIKSAADLEAIHSLGFRGEALASIASVSRVEVKSVARGENVGMLLQLEGGKLTDERPAGGPAGSSFAVKTLFYNTPARRKFLKADSTEYRHCLIAANRFALCFPHIHFTLVHNGVVIWEVKPQSFEERVYEILGKKLKGKILEVEDDAGAVQISGFVGTQDTFRRHGGEQFLFLNDRFITDKSLNHAVVSGYGEILAHGGYPLYVIKLTIDPTRVDVNVHPTKMQVRFADDRLIYSLLRGAVKRTLRSANVIPEFDRFGKSGQTFPEQRPQQVAAEKLDAARFPPAAQTSVPPFRTDDFYPSAVQKPANAGQMQFEMPQGKEDESWLSEKGSEMQREKQFSSAAFTPQAHWQLHNKYIISQTDNGLVIIDQHAAHERILYERALKLFEKSEPVSQRLLFPIMVELSAEDLDVLKEFMPYLEKIGFLLSDFGARTVVIEGVPSGLKIKNHEKVVQDMIDDFKRGKRNKLEVRDNVAKIFACHSSIRTGDALNTTEMAALLDQLFAAETPYFCPHGRPVITKITLDELDKRFGRT